MRKGRNGVYTKDFLAGGGGGDGGVVKLQCNFPIY